MDCTRRRILELAVLPAAMGPLPFHNVRCQKTYPSHLQGVCTGGRDSIYWCFTDVLVKTNARGEVLKELPVRSHHGDLCHLQGRIYVAVNFGLFNDPGKRADSWVYVYDAEDLSLQAKHQTPEMVYGAGGIAHHEGRFTVVGGLPEGFEENYVCQYDAEFHFLARHVLRSGYTLKGIQTAAFNDGHWWLGCYGAPKILLKASRDFRSVRRFEFDCSLGITPAGPGVFLVARGACSKERGCTGQLLLAGADEDKGLVIRAG